MIPKTESAISNPEQMLDGLFIKVTYDQFWHHLMKSSKSESTYNSPDLQKRIQKIIEVRKFNSFTLQSEQGWTPAHVAVLAGNSAGLQFLKLNGALAKEIKDTEGNTPMDLALKFRPELVRFFQEIDVKQSSDLSFFDSLFAEYFVKLPSTPFTYSASDDFGIEIKKLLFPKPYDENNDYQKEAFEKIGLKYDHIVKNIISFGKKFGFEVVFSKGQYPLRDSLIRVSEGVYGVKSSENTPLAIERYNSRSLYFGDNAAFQTDHSFFHSRSGVAHQLTPFASLDLSAFFGHAEDKIPTVRIYMEGGNYYLMQNARGIKFALVGEETLYVALNQLRRDKVFDDPHLGMESIIKDFEKKLSANGNLLIETLEEMYAQGLFKMGKGKDKGFVSKEEISTLWQSDIGPNQSANPYLDRAKQLKYFVPFSLNELQKTKGIKIAAEYLAQKEFTKGFIARTFAVDHVCAVPQLDYHLDVFLRPGPKGSIFVQDYAFSVKVLEEILSQKERLGLTPLDLHHLKRYLETAQKLNHELGSICKKVQKELTQAGFHVIRAPGLFYDVSPDANSKDPSFNLNFLNAVTGWSSKLKSYYYLPMGASVGDRLGGILMNSFEKFMKSYQPDIQMGFMGFDPDNVTDFSEGMRWLNRRGSQAGPHCFSFVMEF